MKKIIAICLMMSFFLVSAASSEMAKRYCKPKKIDSGLLVFKKDIPQKIFNEHIVTYLGLYNGGPSYLLNFDKRQSSLHTDKVGEVKSILDSEPPFFVDFIVESYNDSEIKLRFTRFETPSCYNPNIKLSW